MPPWAVVSAAVLQYSTGATFLVMAFVAYRSGSAAQAAAEAEVVRQGLPADLLERGRVNFRETGVGLLFPLAIALVLAVLASLNLAGNPGARVTTWVFQFLLFVLGGYITSRQVFAVRFIRSAFDKTGDEDLARVDVEKLIEKAMGVFPAWVRVVVAVRLTLVTAGSVAIVVLLALPSAGSYFS